MSLSGNGLRSRSGVGSRLVQVPGRQPFLQRPDRGSAPLRGGPCGEHEAEDVARVLFGGERKAQR